jgi:hypothetical protein
MRDLLVKQIKFEHWANTELIAAMRAASPLNERSIFLLSHILSSSSMWFSRINTIPF